MCLESRAYSDYIKMAEVNGYLVSKCSVKSIKDDGIELEHIHYDKNNHVSDTIKVRVSDDNATVVHDRKKTPMVELQKEISYNILRETKVTEFNLKDEILTVSSAKLTQTIKQDSQETPSPLLADINSILGLNCALVNIFHHRSDITKDVYTARGLESLKDGLENVELCLKSPQKSKK